MTHQTATEGPLPTLILTEEMRVDKPVEQMTEDPQPHESAGSIGIHDLYTD